MAKFKIQNSIWNVLFEALKIYCKNFLKYTQYMLFPVFGQIIGLVLIFWLTGWYTHNLVVWNDAGTLFNNYMVVIAGLFAVTVPGFLIFTKAFWDYIVSYGALNSMTNAVITTGKLYDFDAHRKIITNRAAKYVGLWFVITIMTLIGINPLFWLVAGLAFVYFILVIQAFTFEEDTSIFGCFKSSLNLIKGNFARTFVLAVILGVVCYYLLVIGTEALLRVVRLAEYIKMLLEGWASTLPLDEYNANLAMYQFGTYKIEPLTPLSLTIQVFSSMILFVVAGLTLPLRSICWTLWYKNLSAQKVEKPNKSKKS